MFLNSIFWIVVGTGLISIIVSGVCLVINIRESKKIESRKVCKVSLC